MFRTTIYRHIFAFRPTCLNTGTRLPCTHLSSTLAVRSPFRLISTSSARRDTERVDDTKQAPSSGPRPSKEAPPPGNASIDLVALRTRFRELSGHSAEVVRRRADEFTAKTSSTFSQLGSHLNHITGYEEIEALKLQVEAQGHKLAEARSAARQAKINYDIAVEKRSASQMESNSLIIRSNQLSKDERARFGALFTDAEELEKEEARAKAAVASAEQAVDDAFTEFMRLITARYHEEQVWSDKIRSASTYGSLAALGINLLVFILAIVLVEPWKRKRLAQTFETKVEALSLENTAVVERGMEKLAQHFAEQQNLLLSVVDVKTPTSAERVGTVERPTPVFHGPVFERLAIVARDREITGVVAASVVVVGILGWVARSMLG